MNQEKVAFNSHIGHKYEGQVLIDFLCHRFTYFAREHWVKLIQDKDVLVNDKLCENEYQLKAGDKVSYFALWRSEPLVPKKIPVLYEDRDLLIVNKPPHLAVHPSGRYLRNTMINILKKQKRLDFLVLCHRLDRETSGVTVLAKSQLAKDKMYWQFFDHKAKKTYWALVWGVPHPRNGLIDKPIGTAPKGKSKIRIKQFINGVAAKSAITKYRVLSTLKVEAPHWRPPEWPELKNQTTGPWPVSLVECRPITGRTNQIRVHLASLGSGIVGDKLYDPDEEVFLRLKKIAPQLEDSAPKRLKSYFNISSDLEQRLVLDAHALHAKGLEIRHPRSGEILKIEAPCPKSWQGLYKAP